MKSRNQSEATYWITRTMRFTLFSASYGPVVQRQHGRYSSLAGRYEISDLSFDVDGKKQVITNLNISVKQEKQNMAFVNEKISDKDKTRISSIITFEKVRAVARWIPKFRDPFWWTVNHEHGVYLIFLTGGGREQLPYFVLGIDNQFAVFNVNQKGIGDGVVGLKYHWIVSDLKIPASFEFRREEIKEFIREGLEEYAYFDPLADGGTADNPNIVARTNILSFNVEFK